MEGEGLPATGGALTPATASGAPPREVLLLDAGWKFHLGDIPAPLPNKHIAAYMANKAGHARGAAKPRFDDSGWRTLDLPHDWSVEGAFDPANHLDNGYLPRGIAWYRRHFRLDPSDRGTYLAIQFDGVATHCSVYVNGHLLHRNFCGYTPFTIDISDVANFGDDDLNVIAVRVDATYVEGWWYEGAGIYRHAWLIKAAPLHIATDGMFVRPRRVSPSVWDTHIETMLENTSDESFDCDVVSEIIDPAGVVVVRSATLARVAPRSSRRERDMIPVNDPRLWSLESPQLYSLRTSIQVAGKTVDDSITTFGYRTIRFDAERGFFLNDVPVKLKGTCNHQDHAGVGVAVPDSIHEFRIRRLLEMGCNAYRCAHHPPATELLDACDRLGMLVMDENRNFGSSPEHLAQLRTMVRRDRNHPCVILWSLCNEEAIQGTSVAANIARAMTHAVEQCDPSRPVTAAVSGGILNDNCLADAVEVLGINYQLPLHDAFHAKHPQTPLLASETHCVLSTRGTYETDASKHHFTSFDEDHADWGATARETWRFVSARPFIAGLFVWTGFDYRGEPTPDEWPCVNSHFGIMDICGFPKDAFFLHKAYFTTEPFVHLLPHWSRPANDAQPVRVIAYSNCDAVELLLNGESLSRKTVNRIDMAEWRVPYRPGTLRAVGFRDGRVVAETQTETAGPPAAIGLEIHPSMSANPIPADGAFAVPITAFALDARSRRVPTADDAVTFALTGPGRILGVANGDPTCHEPDKGLRRSASRRLFRGLAQVIVQTSTTAGTLRLTASAPALEPAVLELHSVPVTLRPSVPAAIHGSTKS